MGFWIDAKCLAMILAAFTSGVMAVSWLVAQIIRSRQLGPGQTIYPTRDLTKLGDSDHQRLPETHDQKYLSVRQQDKKLPPDD